MPFGQILKAGLKKLTPKKPMATRVNKITETKKGIKKPQATKLTLKQLTKKLKESKTLSERSKIEKEIEELNIPHFLKPQASGIAGTSILLNSGLNKKDR